MIELIDNIIQMVITAICAAVCVSRTVAKGREKGREWLLLALFLVEYSLGDLYSVLYLAFYHETPPYSYIPDLAWYTSFLFLMMLVIYVSDKRSIKMITRYQLFIPVFTVGSAVFFVIDSGDIPGNIISTVITTASMWLAGGGLHLERKSEDSSGAKKLFYILVLTFFGLEYGLWYASCFWMGDTIMNPYFWIDTMMSVNMLCMLPALGRVVKDR